jgi:hypothetical protein
VWRLHIAIMVNVIIWLILSILDISTAIYPKSRFGKCCHLLFVIRYDLNQSNHIKVDIETFQFLELSQITLLQFDKTVWTKSLSHDYQWRKWSLPIRFGHENQFSGVKIFFARKNWRLDTIFHFCEKKEMRQWTTFAK